MTTTTTLTRTLSSLGFFATTIVVVFGLVRNIFWTSVFLGQLGAWCSKLDYIIQGYFKGTLASLTGYAVPLAIDLTTLVGITRTVSCSLFMLWHVSLAWPILPQFEHVNYYLKVV